MGRLIPTRELVDSGLIGPFAKLAFETRCAQQRGDFGAVRLWRSSKGYRNACRMLRRAGLTVEKRRFQRPSLDGFAHVRMAQALARELAADAARILTRPNPIYDRLGRGK